MVQLHYVINLAFIWTIIDGIRWVYDGPDRKPIRWWSTIQLKCIRRPEIICTLNWMALCMWAVCLKICTPNCHRRWCHVTASKDVWHRLILLMYHRVSRRMPSCRVHWSLADAKGQPNVAKMHALIVAFVFSNGMHTRVNATWQRIQAQHATMVRNTYRCPPSEMNLLNYPFSHFRIGCLWIRWQKRNYSIHISGWQTTRHRGGLNCIGIYNDESGRCPASHWKLNHPGLYGIGNCKQNR